MAKNIVFPGVYTRTLPVVSGVVSGEVVKVGDFVGVALTDRGKDGVSDTTATVSLGCAATVTAAAATYAVGDPIYGHANGGSAVTGRVQLIDKTSTTGTLLGRALEAKTLGSAGPLRVQFAL